MKKIAYYPAQTTLHNLHPFTKFFILIMSTILIFFIDSALLMAILWALTIALFVVLHQNPLRYFGMRTTLITAIMIGLIQCIFYNHGEVLLQMGQLVVTNQGVQRALVVGLRFMIIILNSYLFILTTAPSDLAYGFMQIGIPYRYAFMIVTAMRFVPILSAEGERIYHAQRLRGACYSLKDLRGTLQNITTYIGAVLYALVSHVNKLAISMETRSFGRYALRTYQRQVQFRLRDGMTLVFFALMCSFFIIYITKGTL